MIRTYVELSFSCFTCEVSLDIATTIFNFQRTSKDPLLIRQWFGHQPSLMWSHRGSNSVRLGASQSFSPRKLWPQFTNISLFFSLRSLVNLSAILYVEMMEFESTYLLLAKQLLRQLSYIPIYFFIKEKTKPLCVLLIPLHTLETILGSNPNSFVSLPKLYSLIKFPYKSY